MSSWNQYLGDRLTCCQPVEVELNPATVRGLEVAWEFEATAPILASCSVLDGVAYFGSSDGHIYAVNSTTGRYLWQSPTPGAIRGHSSGVSKLFIRNAGNRRHYDSEHRWRIDTRQPEPNGCKLLLSDPH